MTSTETTFETVRQQAYELLGEARDLLGEQPRPRGTAQAVAARDAVSLIAAARAALLKVAPR